MTSNEADARFSRAVEDILAGTWDFYPNLAASLGLHDYDGALPDISPVSLSSRAHQVQRGLRTLGQIQSEGLSRQNYFDYRILIAALRKELFELTEVRPFATNPMDTQWHVDMSNYILRDYAPLEQRVASLTRALNEVPRFMENLRSHLSKQLSRPVIQTAIESYEGTARFYSEDVTAAIEPVVDQSVKQDCKRAIEAASRSVLGFVEYLKNMEQGAGDEFAIGADRFLTLLRYGEMVDLPLERLLEIGQEDLARNLTRMRHASRRLNPTMSPTDTMKEIARDHPLQENLITETNGMLERTRQFLIDHDIVTVPSEDRCKTVETPSFMRWATAAMDFPGPLETAATEAYYYVTPVEPHWTDIEKEQWLSGFNYATLTTVNVHETYPGHYLHYLHTRNSASKISQIFGAYSFWEGWAHYVEEMMIEEGFGGNDPKLEMGQIAEALLRDCRFVCAIRMHTQGMTVDEATRFMMDNAFMEEHPARKEAMRGTFDPMYLNYTLGKLMILKLREDYRAEQGEDFSLKFFHDTLLSFGAPPIPLVREMMLRSHANTIL